MAEAKKSNVEVSLSPFPQKVPGIIAAGYYWPMGKATKRVVSAEDADLLEAHASRTVKDPKSGKIEQRSRFAFTRMRDVETPAAEKLPNRRGVANTPALEIPQEKYTQALQEHAAKTQEVINQLPELIRSLRK